MTDPWNDNQPIYRQLYERVVLSILRGDFREGDALPSVRQLAADYRINHLTVAKAYQALVDEGLVERRRGRGMYVCAGASERLLSRERSHFLEKELPELLERARQLGLGPEQIRAIIDQYQWEETP